MQFSMFYTSKLFFVSFDLTFISCSTFWPSPFLLYYPSQDGNFVLKEAIETMVACSAMALVKEQESKEEEASSSKSSWAKWKRGGIIGAAALTGGTLMAITGGMKS